MMKKLFNVIVLLILMLGLATPVFAQDGHEQPGQVIFGSSRSLAAGDVITSDLVIFGGNLTMADGSRVEGSVVVFGGNGDISGEIDGDMAIIGGNARLSSTARVNGDVASVGGKATIADGAYVQGQVVETNNFDFSRLPAPFRPGTPPVPQFNVGPRFQPFDQFVRLVLALIRALIVAVVVSAIGLLAVLFLPDHTQMVSRTVRQAAPSSFGIGLLTLIVGVLAVLLLAITICLIPIALLVLLALGVATLYGWIVVGYLLGLRMLQRLQRDTQPTPVAAALVGIFTVTIIQQSLIALSRLPCLGFLFWLLGAGLWLLVASTGLGAVVLTRFGTQSYQGPAASRTPPPALPPVPPSQPEVPPETETRPSQPAGAPEDEAMVTPAPEAPAEDQTSEPEEESTGSVDT
jgi:hypothetical protein